MIVSRTNPLQSRLGHLRNSIPFTDRNGSLFACTFLDSVKLSGAPLCPLSDHFCYSCRLNNLCLSYQHTHKRENKRIQTVSIFFSPMCGGGRSKSIEESQQTIGRDCLFPATIFPSLLSLAVYIAKQTATYSSRLAVENLNISHFPDGIRIIQWESSRYFF